MARARSRPGLPRPAPPAAPPPGPGRAGEDPGPPERYRHGDIIRAEPGDEAGVQLRRVTTQSVLDRYLARGQIAQRQFDAGMKLYRLWRASGGGQRVIAAYGPRIAGRTHSAAEMTERQAVLRQGVTAVLRRMGPLSGILVRVCLCDEAARDWAQARGDAPQGGVVVLRLALDALADHWRL